VRLTTTGEKMLHEKRNFGNGHLEVGDFRVYSKTGRGKIYQGPVRAAKGL